MKPIFPVIAAVFLCIAATANGDGKPDATRLTAADIRVMKVVMDSPELLRTAGLDCRAPRPNSTCAAARFSAAP